MTKSSGQPSVTADATWPPLSPTQHRTLDTVFRHPIAHNLEWRDVESLFGTLGAVEARGGGEFVMRLGQEHHTLHKPRTKDIPAEDVMALRRLLQRAGITHVPVVAEPALVAQPEPTHPMFLVALDHHGATMHRLDPAGDAGPALTFTPEDPHRSAHQEADRGRGQRTAETDAYYEKISLALADAGQVVVMGHGHGHSNAAHLLVEYLHTHHHPSHGRVVTEIVTDLSAITSAQTLRLGRQALGIG